MSDPVTAREIELKKQLAQKTVELSGSVSQQAATSEILRIIAGSPANPQAILDAVAESAARLSEANDALIYQITDGLLKGVANYGPLPGQRGEGPPTTDRGTIPGRAVIDRETVHVHDLAAVPREDLRATLSRALGARSVLATPLMREGTPIGVIQIRRTQVRPFSERQIGLLKTFADQAMIAIENVRLFQEIQRKNRQLEIANERLQDLDRLKTDFVSNVSHELRTPLTAIKGAVDLVLRKVAGPLTGKQTHYLQRVRSNTQYLSGLINDLLDLSRIESGKIEVKTDHVSFRQLVYEVVESLRPLAAEKSIDLELIGIKAPLPLCADRNKVNQVLMNLIGNAIKFTPAHGRVTIAASRSGGFAQLSVTDTGPGIAPGEREKIFDKFYQIAETKDGKPKGTGLGLAICRALVELHGGRIWIESGTSGGSMFSFSLPLHQGRETE